MVIDTLSRREMEVISQIASGARLKDIAINLNVKQSTISTYKHRLMQKLNVNNVVDLFKSYTNECSIKKHELIDSPKLSEEYEDAETALDDLFGKHDIELSKITIFNRSIYRQVILNKYMQTCDYSTSGVMNLQKILLYLSSL